MPPQLLELPAFGPVVAINEFRAYMESLSEEKFARLQDTYSSSNVSPNHSDFEDLLVLIERTLKIYKNRLEELGRPSQLDDRTLKFALETGLKNCAAPPRDIGFALPEGTTGATQYMEMLCLTFDLEDLLRSNSEGHQPHSQGARASQQPPGQHPAESRYRHSAARPRDTRDQRRSPPPSDSHRHSGPSRQSDQALREYLGNLISSSRHSVPTLHPSGQASRGYGGGQASRRRYEEESSSDGDW